VPAHAVDQAGWRLGRGAGYFYRALVHARGPICSMVYADELLPVVPHQDHDVPVDLVVTEAGIFRVPQSR
jgi:5-formyltetrahydrofolate cyclo-ligase